MVGKPIMPEVLPGTLVPRDRVDALTARIADELQLVFDDAYDIRDGGTASRSRA